MNLQSVPGPIDRVLLACLHRNRTLLKRAELERLSDVAWSAVFDEARRQRVRPQLRSRLHEEKLGMLVPHAVRSRLDSECRSIALRNVRYLAETAALARDLAQHGIPMMALKGIHMASGVYRSAADREMNDIDVMVPRQALGVTCELLGQRGYRPVRTSHIAVDTLVCHHVARRIKTGTASIEVHWTLAPPGEIGPVYVEGLWDRAVSCSIGNVDVRVLSPEDLLLHLCGHASHHHRFEIGLRPFVDVSAVVDLYGQGIDWPVLAQRAREWGWSRGFYLTLSLASDLVGAQVPRHALETLEPPDDASHIARAVVDHVFGRQMVTREISRLVGEAPFHSRVRHLLRRVLLPHAMAASFYGLPLDAPRYLYLACYVRRLLDLMRRYTVLALTLFLKFRSPARQSANRQNLIGRWLGRR